MTAVFEEFDRLEGKDGGDLSEKVQGQPQVESVWHQILNDKRFDKFDLFIIERELSSLIDENNDFARELASLEQILYEAKPKNCSQYDQSSAQVDPTQRKIPKFVEGPERKLLQQQILSYQSELELTKSVFESMKVSLSLPWHFKVLTYVSNSNKSTASAHALEPKRPQTARKKITIQNMAQVEESNLSIAVVKQALLDEKALLQKYIHQIRNQLDEYCSHKSESNDTQTDDIFVPTTEQLRSVCGILENCFDQRRKAGKLKQTLPPHQRGKQLAPLALTKPHDDAPEAHKPHGYLRPVTVFSRSKSVKLYT